MLAAGAELRVVFFFFFGGGGGGLGGTSSIFSLSIPFLCFFFFLFLGDGLT